jgi:chromosome segregation ATPase|uniref:Chromosome partition protein Smc n=1 Tax=Anaerolinea thermolimosa TaxID=229919 RepID=A0A7C4PTP3_9CHLR
MDLDQLQKRLEFLENEHRKDKAIIDTLEQRLAQLESGLPELQQQSKEISSEVVRLSMIMSRFDQLDAALTQLRMDFTRDLEAIEKLRLDHDRELEKVRLADLESFQKAIGELRKGQEPLPELRKALQARVEEDFRLARLIEELEVKLLETKRSDEEYRRAQKLIEDGQRQEARRMTDLQGEVAAMRKRLDEQRGRLDLVNDSLRKIETRISDLQNTENERRQTISTFIDKQNMLQLERERVWKDWQTRFEVIERQSVNLDTQVQALDALQRSVRRAQEGFEEITQRFERRINEITEMQRLAEERFRQEWVAFRAEDQKRWTNYSLVQEEQQRELARQFDRSSEQLTQLADQLQELQDAVQLITAETQKQLQGLLAMAHEWVEDFDRSFGQGK